MNIEAFLSEYLVNRSEETKKAYRSDLVFFQTFLREIKLPVARVRPRHVNLYTEWLKRARNARTKQPGLSDSTIQRRIAAVSSFYSWLQYHRPSLANPTTFFKYRRLNEEREINALPASIVQQMCQAARCPRDIALVELLRRSGLRLSECVQLNKDSIKVFRERQPGGAVILYGAVYVMGKGHKQRRVLIHESALEAIADYLEERGHDTEAALFLSSRRKRLSKRQVQVIVAQMGRSAEAGHVHPHQLRHTFGTEMINAGMQEVVLQKLLGHRHLSTTLRYGKASAVTINRQFHAAMELVDADHEKHGSRKRSSCLRSGRIRRRRN